MEGRGVEYSLSVFKSKFRSIPLHKRKGKDKSHGNVNEYLRVYNDYLLRLYDIETF